MENGHETFYFHLRREGELVADYEGTELPNVTAARREAEQGAREMLAEAIKTGRDTSSRRLHCRG